MFCKVNNSLLDMLDKVLSLEVEHVSKPTLSCRYD